MDTKFQLGSLHVNREVPAFFAWWRDQGRRRRLFCWDQTALVHGTARQSSRWNGYCSQPSQTRNRLRFRSWDWRICDTDDSHSLDSQYTYSNIYIYTTVKIDSSYWILAPVGLYLDPSISLYTKCDIVTYVNKINKRCFLEARIGTHQIRGSPYSNTPVVRSRSSTVTRLQKICLPWQWKNDVIDVWFSMVERSTKFSSKFIL